MTTTVITPTISTRSQLLLECINSVVGQTIKPAGHIIVMDTHKEGPSASRNKGVKAADTEWISFLDDDDIFYPNHIEIHSQYFDESVDVIYSWAMISFPGGAIKEFKGNYNKSKMLEGHNTMPITTSVRKELFLDVGGFDRNARFEDLELWQRLIRAKARFFVVREFTWEYRVQPDGRNSEE